MPRVIVPATRPTLPPSRRLERLGFSNPERGHRRRPRLAVRPLCRDPQRRARERLAEFLPSLLDAFGHTAEPDLALGHLRQGDGEMPAGVQLFSLLAANPSLLRLVADIMGTAPRLARIIGRRPRLLDAVLDPGFFGAVPTPAQAEGTGGRALAEAVDYQDALDRARIVGREQGFLIGVRVISGHASRRGRQGAAYADLAETLIEALAEECGGRARRPIWADAGGKAAVLAMGKLGGREMTAGSDLDLIIVYDFEGDSAQSDGAKSLPGSQYYTRFTQRLIAALSAQTAEGSLYQVDMRLRPSGNQGPVATKLSSFIDYQDELGLDLGASGAYPGARGDRTARRCGAQIEATIWEVLRRPRDRAAVAADVRAMRAKIDEEKGTADIWDLKHVRGGLIDHRIHRAVPADRERRMSIRRCSIRIPSWRWRSCFRRQVITLGDAEILVPAATALSHADPGLAALSRQALRSGRGAARAQGLARPRLRHAGFPTLEETLKETLAAVRQAFDRIVSG